MRSVLRFVAGVAVVLLVVMAVTWVNQARAPWPWQVSPTRIEYCGRTYERAGGEPQPRVEVASAAAAQGAILERVGRLPPLVGRSVWAAPTDAPEGWTGEWTVCATQVWVATGDGQVAGYGLVGGP